MNFKRINDITLISSDTATPSTGVGLLIAKGIVKNSMLRILVLILKQVNKCYQIN